ARPRRLVAVGGVGPLGELRGGAGDAARGDAARPALVSGKPPAPAPALHARALRRPPRAVPERRARLRLGAAVALLPRVEHDRGDPAGHPRARLLPGRPEPLPAVAG